MISAVSPNESVGFHFSFFNQSMYRCNTLNVKYCIKLLFHPQFLSGKVVLPAKALSVEAFVFHFPSPNRKIINNANANADDNFF